MICWVLAERWKVALSMMRVMPLCSRGTRTASVLPSGLPSRRRAIPFGVAYGRCAPHRPCVPSRRGHSLFGCLVQNRSHQDKPVCRLPACAWPTPSNSACVAVYSAPLVRNARSFFTPDLEPFARIPHRIVRNIKLLGQLLKGRVIPLFQRALQCLPVQFVAALRPGLARGKIIPPLYPVLHAPKTNIKPPRRFCFAATLPNIIYHPPA